MIRSNLNKFESWDKMHRFYGAVNWPEMYTYTLKLDRFAFEVWYTITITSSYLYVAVSKNRAAVLLSPEIVASFT